MHTSSTLIAVPPETITPSTAKRSLDHKVSGLIASALIGLVAIILGLLIVHFTPDERHTK
jgi:hypothetical protein